MIGTLEQMYQGTNAQQYNSAEPCSLAVYSDVADAIDACDGMSKLLSLVDRVDREHRAHRLVMSQVDWCQYSSAVAVRRDVLLACDDGMAGLV